MTEQLDQPERDTSPSGEVSARQQEDGTYEIVAGDSSATNMAPPSDASKTDDRREGSADDSRRTGWKATPLTIGLLVLTLAVAAGTVAYYATSVSGGQGEQGVASEEEGEEASFKPYEGDEQPVAEPAPEQAVVEEDASESDPDVGPRERKTEIIVLEEDMEEEEAAEQSEAADNATVDRDKFKALDIGPGTAARLKDSARLNVDPAKLRNIKFTNGNVPEAQGQVERKTNGPNGSEQATPEDQPPEQVTP